MKRTVLVISERDNVATSLDRLEVGRVIDVAGAAIVVREEIPRGHKIALRFIAAGQPVIKYGSPIGLATMNVDAGAHVHTHNVASSRGRGDLASRPIGGEQASPRIAEPLNDRPPSDDADSTIAASGGEDSQPGKERESA